VRDGDQRRVAIEWTVRQNVDRPVCRNVDVPEAFGSGKTGSRINDPDLEIRQLGDPRQRLANVNGADDNDNRRGTLRVQEDLAITGLDNGRPA